LIVILSSTVVENDLLLIKHGGEGGEGIHNLTMTFGDTMFHVADLKLAVEKY